MTDATVTQADYIERRLREGGLRLRSGSPTMLQDELSSYEASRDQITPALHEGGRFREWQSVDLAQQCLAQAREQLDPEFSAFMTAVAERLASSPPQVQGQTDAARLNCTCAEIAGEDPDCVLHGRGTLWAKENPDVCELADRYGSRQTDALREALNKALYLAVSTLAFHGRDRGTERQDRMLDGLEAIAREVDPLIRATLTATPPTATTETPDKGESVDVLERMWRALGAATAFSAYQAADPLALRFEFPTEEARLRAADAVDQAFLLGIEGIRAEVEEREGLIPIVRARTALNQGAR